MNSLIKFLTFDAERPTYAYEMRAYMAVRAILAAAVAILSIRVSASAVAWWVWLSAATMLVGAWAAQTVRSGAHRRAETRRRTGAADVMLPCDADLMRAAAIGSFCASLAPILMLVYGVTIAGASNAAGVAAVCSAVQSGFDVAWSEAIYPAWRRFYTARRDALREVAARVQWENRPDRFVKTLCKACGGDGLQGLPDKTMLEADEVTCEKCEKVMKSRSKPFDSESKVEGAKDRKRRLEFVAFMVMAGRYIRCASLDELLKRTSETLPVGTGLYLNDDSPVVEYEGMRRGWTVNWHDGTRGAVRDLYEGGKDRERFLAMVERRSDVNDSIEDDDAATTVMSRDMLPGADDPPMKIERFVRCESLDDLLARTAESAPIGTCLYLSDDSPVVEYDGRDGWIVDWHDGTFDDATTLSKSPEKRVRFVAMAEGRIA